MQRIAVKNEEPAASRAVSAQFIPTNGSDGDEPSLAAGAAAQLEGQRVQGLSEQEAAQRLKVDGYNELPSTKRRACSPSPSKSCASRCSCCWSPRAALYLVLGDIQEALMLLGFVFVVMGITIYQERKTERALEALRDLSSPRALVIRDGEQKRIPGREVVRGDIVVLAEGDRVPADAVLLACRQPVGRRVAADRRVGPRAQGALGRRRRHGAARRRRPAVRLLRHAGRPGPGRGAGRRHRRRTEIGKIGKALQTVETEKTPLADGDRPAGAQPGASSAC